MTSKILPIALFAFLAAACSGQPLWQHETLRGLTAETQLPRDEEQCITETPHALPSAFYPLPGVGVYESQDGRISVLTRMSEAARVGTIEAVREHFVRIPFNTRMLDDTQRDAIYRHCMARHGWVDRRRPGSPSPETSVPPTERLERR